MGTRNGGDDTSASIREELLRSIEHATPRRKGALGLDILDETSSFVRTLRIAVKGDTPDRVLKKMQTFHQDIQHEDSVFQVSGLHPAQNFPRTG